MSHVHTKSLQGNRYQFCPFGEMEITERYERSGLGSIPSWDTKLNDCVYPL